MAGEWRTLPLGEVAAVRSGYAFKSSDWTESGVPVVKIANVKSGRLEMAGCSFVDEAVASGAGDFRLSVGDILIAMTGYVGDVARVRKADLPCVLNQRVGKFTVLSRERIDADYLFQFLAWADTRQTIAGLGYGSAQPNVSPALIHKVEIPLPPLPEQKRIAHILGTLDDKIELNRRMNATLEAMSRAIFKSWFVDFDPVRQKAAGKQPVGMDAETAALFPGSFEDSVIGEVPKGWAMRTVESLCEFVTSGGTPARKHPEYWEGGDVSWFKTGELLDGPLLESEEKISQEGLANSSCKLWPENTVLFALYASPTVGRLGVLTTRATANQAAAALKAKPEFGTGFLVNVLLEAREKLQRIAVGAAQQNINQGILKAHSVIVPPASLAAAFSKWADEVFSQRTALARQSRNLAALRDTLLPKLLSGEVRVPEAEGMVKEAVG